MVQSENQNKLNIQLFRQFKLIMHSDQRAISFERSRKKIALIAMLVLNGGKVVPVDTLFENIWKREKSKNRESLLRVLVLRTREQLAKLDPKFTECILAASSGYAWNMELTAEVDALEMDELCKRIIETHERTVEHDQMLDKMQRLYSGELLTELSQEEWIQRYGWGLRQRYIAAVIHAVHLLGREEKHDLERTIIICERGIEAVPGDNRLLYEINSAIEQKKTAYAINTADELYNMPAREPSLSNDTDEVSLKLREAVDGLEGAFVCDFEMLTHIYVMQYRSMVRQWQPICLVMVSLDGEGLHPLEMNLVMKKLGNVLQYGLRMCDTVARYNMTTYAVLLHGAPQANVQGVLDRIRRRFYKETGGVGKLDMRYNSKLLTEENFNRFIGM